MIPYNDSFGDYVDMLIKDEEAKKEEIRDKGKIEKLKEEKQQYEMKKRLIKTTISSSSEGKFKTSPVEEIYKRKKKLCSLKHNGRILREAFDGVMSARQRMFEENRRGHLQINGSDSLWSRFLSKVKPLK